MKTVIMAGGRGTRISSIASDIPKPMIRINDKPVLQSEIESLKKQGFHDFIITISHLGHVNEDYFGDGSDFGVSIEY
ncbi:MAG: NTP transferase domain-containing protein, partial [Erysipelotrichaceae bacterium]|nr:NTP transferase domain-containing protein [Erysipelotrichaceae bacterium]